MFKFISRKYLCLKIIKMNKNLKLGLILLGVGIAGRIYTKDEKQGTLVDQSSSMKGLSNLIIFVGGAVTIYNIIK